MPGYRQVSPSPGGWSEVLIIVFRCDMNKMTAANLAVVFGPNLAWPNDKVKVPVIFSQVINL